MEILKMEEKYVIGNKVQLIYVINSGVFIASPDEILLYELDGNEIINKNKDNILTKNFPNQLYNGDKADGEKAKNVCLELDKIYFSYYLNRGFHESIFYFIKKHNKVYFIKDTPKNIGEKSIKCNKEELEKILKEMNENEVGKYIYLAREGLVYAKNNVDGLIIDNFEIDTEEKIEENYNFMSGYQLFNKKENEEENEKEKIKFLEIDNYPLYGTHLFGVKQDYIITYNNNGLKITNFSVKINKGGIYQIDMIESKVKIKKNFFVPFDVIENIDITNIERNIKKKSLTKKNKK